MKIESFRFCFSRSLFLRDLQLNILIWIEFTCSWSFHLVNLLQFEIELELV